MRARRASRRRQAGVTRAHGGRASLAPAGRRGHPLPARQPVRPSRKNDRLDPFFIELEFLDESFTSIINFIRLVKTVPKLAVEEAAFVSVASSCGPLPPRPHLRAKRRRA